MGPSRAGGHRDAYGVSRRTLFAWRAKLLRGGGNAAELAPRSTRPRRVRRRRVAGGGGSRNPPPARPPTAISARKSFIGCSSRFCTAQGLPCPAVRPSADSSPTRTTKCVWSRPTLPALWQSPRAPRRDRKPKGYRTENPGDCVAFDGIERRRDGLRRRLITCLDLASRFGFALGVYSSLQSPGLHRLRTLPARTARAPASRPLR